ncbi:MAG TPA: hypothetical protein PKN30_13845, partial [Flavobacteriales bacterium]|nr:hypothetical protein [Flavobacteriales bacterium]
AKASAIISVEELQEAPFKVTLGPVPASSEVVATGWVDGPMTVWWDVVGLDGRFVQRSTGIHSGEFRQVIDVSALAAGGYILRATQDAGGRLFEQRFEVVR